MTGIAKLARHITIVDDPPDLKEGELGPCWEWEKKNRDKDGYGLFKHKNKTYRAIRVVWVLSNGYMEEGVVILHRCDNPPCCRPSHLYADTHQANMDDMKAKGRQAKGDRVATAKLTWTKVHDMRADHETGEYSMHELAAKYNVHYTTAIRIIKGDTWNDADIGDATEPVAGGDAS